METFHIAKFEAIPDRLDEICEEIVSQSLRHAVDVVIKRHQKERSPDQNAALWAVAYPAIGNHCGYRRDDYEFLHREFCKLYFGKVPDPMLGDRPKRTTTTNELGERDVIGKLDFARFYEFVQQVAAEKLGVNVPDPDKHWRQNLGVA